MENKKQSKEATIAEELRRLFGQQIASKSRFRLDASPEIVSMALRTAYIELLTAIGLPFIPTPEVEENIARAAGWLTDPRPEAPRSLMLRGPKGNGKTTLANALTQTVSLFAKIQDFRIDIRTIPARDIADMSRENDGEKRLRALRDVQLLVLDDFGEEPSEILNFGSPRTAVADILFRRYDLRLPTVLTTNLTGKEIQEHYGVQGERLRDRLREMCEVINFRDPSFRGGQIRKIETQKQKPSTQTQPCTPRK